MTPLEQNKFIAEYMGYTYYPHNCEALEGKYDAGWKRHPKAYALSKMNFHPFIDFPPDAYLCRGHNGLMYNRSWNAQIPVWAKLSREIHSFYKSLTRDDLERWEIFEHNYMSALNIDSPSSGLDILVLTLKWFRSLSFNIPIQTHTVLVPKDITKLNTEEAEKDFVIQTNVVIFTPEELDTFYNEVTSGKNYKLIPPSNG